MKKQFLYLILILFIGGPILQSCGSNRRCSVKKSKKHFAKKNYWKPKKKHKRSKWGR